MTESLRSMGRGGKVDLSISPTDRKKTGKDGRHRKNGYNLTLRNELMNLEYINAHFDVSNHKVTLFRAQSNEGRKISKPGKQHNGYVAYTSNLPSRMNELVGDYMIDEQTEDRFILVPYQEKTQGKPRAFVKKSISSKKEYDFKFEVHEEHLIEIKCHTTEELKETINHLNEWARGKLDISFVDYKRLQKA